MNYIEEILQKYGIQIHLCKRRVTDGYMFRIFDKQGKIVFFPYSDSNLDRMYHFTIDLLYDKSLINDGDMVLLKSVIIDFDNVLFDDEIKKV